MAITKLGKTSKTGFIMIKNQLMAQASTSKKLGYELTFINSSIKKTSSSTPNSPKITGNETTSTNIPLTAPLNPIPSPNGDTNQQQPQLKQAHDPFSSDMPEINIADQIQKQNDDAKIKMNKERKNSLPTTPDKPKIRPKLSQEQIKRFRPPAKKPLPSQHLHLLHHLR